MRVSLNKLCIFVFLAEYSLIWSLILSYEFRGSDAAACSTGTKFGENNPNSKDDDLGTNLDYGYMMGDPDYIINCCGVVKSWVANFDGVSGSRTVYFQVWRPVSGSTFELVGQNAMTVSSNGEKSINVNQASRITVKSGDQWGWWTSGTDIITYKQGGGEEDDNYMMTLTSLSAGDTHDWNMTPVDDRSYAVRMDIADNSAPTFTNLPTTVTISGASAGAGTSIFTVTISDVDTYDISTLTLSMTSNAKYSFDTSTYILTAATSLAGAATVDTLGFKAVDQCSNSATATLTVSITNEPPVINNLPSSASVSEDATVETLLFTLNATDPENSYVTCSLTSTNPASAPFLVRQIPYSTDYGIYSKSSPGFDYSTASQYDLTISCSDGQYSDTRTFSVYIVQNTPPVFINLQNSTTVSTFASIGDTAFQVLVSDTDQLSFSMTCDPATCPFTIFDSGIIQISEDLSGHSTVGYDLYITVSDGRNTVGPRTLTITISDINNPVLLNNLPSTATVSENTAIGSTVYTVSYSDPDTSQTKTFSMTSSPTAGLNYFSLNSSSGEITVKSLINYETLGSTTFVLNVTVSDTVATDSDTLTIDVTNVNEAPSFLQTKYTISTKEGSAGTVIGSPSFQVTDPDSGDKVTLTLDCGSETGYFLMNSSTGQVSYQSDYDLDTGSLSSTVTCNVTGTDSGGLTTIATLKITISDANDHTPVFSPTYYTFYTSYYANAGTNVGTITATDDDAGSFGILTYMLDQTSLAVEHFSIDSSGVITVKTTPKGSVMGYATSVTLTATASDVGGQSDTAVVVIFISDTTTVVTTTTTDRYRTFLEDSRNIVWVSGSAVVLAISMAALIYVVYTCHGPNSCQQFRRTFMNTRKKRFLKRLYPQRDRSYSLDSISRDRYSSGRNRATVEPATIRKPPPPIEHQPWRREV